MSFVSPATAPRAASAPFADLAPRVPTVPPVLPQAARAPFDEDGYDGEVRSPQRPAHRALLMQTCDVIGAVATDRAAVERAAANGERHAVHYYLAHPASYVRALRFRDRCLELSRLHALLGANDASEAAAGTPASNYTWQAYVRLPHDSVTTTADGKVTFVLSDAHAPAPCDHDDFTLERAEAFVYDLEPGVTVTRRPWHDCAWGTATPVLVLMALLRHGYAEQAQALLDAGCPLPTQVVEKWHVGAPALEATGGSWRHAWTVRQRPIAACLDNAGPNVAASLRVALAAGARPSARERLRMLRWLPAG